MPLHNIRPSISHDHRPPHDDTPSVPPPSRKEKLLEEARQRDIIRREEYIATQKRLQLQRKPVTPEKNVTT